MVLAGYFFSTLFNMLSTGYTDERYWLPSSTIFLYVVFRVSSAYSFLGDDQPQRSFSRVPFAMLISFGILGAFSSLSQVKPPIDTTIADVNLINCIQEYDDTVMVNVETHATQAARIAATSKVKTIFAPNDRFFVDTDTWKQIAQDYDVEYWLVSSEDQIPNPAKDFFKPMYCTD